MNSHTTSPSSSRPPYQAPNCFHAFHAARQDVLCAHTNAGTTSVNASRYSASFNRVGRPHPT